MEEVEFSIVVGDVAAGGGGSFASATSSEAFIQKLPSNWTTEQLKQYIIENHPKKYNEHVEILFLDFVNSSFPPATPSLTIANQLPQLLKKFVSEHIESRIPMTIKEHIAKMKEPIIVMNFDELRGDQPMEGTLLSDAVNKIREKLEARKRSRPVFVMIHAYDNVARQAIEKQKMRSVEEAVAVFNEALELSHKMSSIEDIFKVLHVHLCVECPYHYLNFTDKEFIKSNQDKWRKSEKTLADNFENFVKTTEGTRYFIDFLLSEEYIAKMLLTKHSHSNMLSEFLQQIDTRFSRSNPVMLLEAIKVIPTKQLFLFFCKCYNISDEKLPPIQVKELVKLLGNNVFEEAPFDKLPQEFVNSILNREVDILPDTKTICAMTADEVRQKIIDYTGYTQERLSLVLEPKGSSEAGFLKKGDHIGEVIKADAQTLQDLGISRKKIAAQLAELIQKAGHNRQVTIDNIQIRGMSYCGSQSDPFHPSFGNPLCVSGTDYTITNTKNGKSLRSSEMMPSLIKSLCFFESSHYRVDPTLLNDVLNG